MNHLRVPPQAIEVERHVLGAMLLDPEAQAVAVESLKSEDFYLNHHRDVFEAISGLFSRGDRPDVLTLSEALKRAGNPLDDVLMEISGEVVSSASISEHCQIVKDKSVLRALIGSATKTLESAYSMGATAEDVVAEAESGVFAVSQAVNEQKLVHIRDHLKNTFKTLESRANGTVSGIPIGIKGFDTITGGLHPGELMILAGRPKMGKTALAISAAAHAASLGKKVAFFSLEMAGHELCVRLLGALSGVPNTKINMGKFGGIEAQKIHDASMELASRGIWIDASASKRPIEILSQCKRMKAQHGLDLVFVDYLQLLTGNEKGSRGQSREQEVSSCSRFLKRSCMELEIPFVALAQLSRETEKRHGGDNRPRASDLRESGSIEQDANLVALIHRPDYYSKEAEANKAELIVDLSRNCPPFTADMTYHGERTLFTDYVDPGFAHGIEDGRYGK